MPAKGKALRPQAVIDKYVKRYMNGEQATALAKEAGISKPGFYLWIQKHKQQIMEQSKTKDMSPKDADIANKRELLIELEQLRLENRKMREKLIALMLKSGEI